MKRLALLATAVVAVAETYRRGYTWPVAGGVAAWAHCLVGDERMSRWLRANADYEPEPVA